jgi:D-xylose transport system substrate-binding protein
MAVLEPANDAGTIKSVGEAFTDGWLPANGQRNMEQVAQPDEAVSVQR